MSHHFLPFLPVSCSFVALPEKDLSAGTSSCDASSLKYITICGSASPGRSFFTAHELAASFTYSALFLAALPAQRQQALPLSSHLALTLHQIQEQQGAAAQHWLFSWPDKASKGFQHRRDTSCGLGTPREIFPALAPLQRL